MYAKSFVFGIAMVISLPIWSYAQSHTTDNWAENINTSDIPNGSIVVISKEETDTPEYVHTKYVFVDQLCGTQIVDRYGTPVNPNDTDLKRAEKRMCMELAMNTRDND
jgi:hypothetical protein